MTPRYDVLIDGLRLRRIELTRPAGNPSRVIAAIDGRRVEADAVQMGPGAYSILLDGRSFELHVEAAGDRLLLRAAGREFRVEIADPRSWRRGRGVGVDVAGHQQVTAPMAGKIVRVLVATGQHVEAGQGLFVVEAMKMQNEIQSPKAGTVERLLAEPGRTVETGEVLAVVA